MTSGSAPAKALGGAGYEHLEPLPDPPRDLEMQQDIPIYDFRRILHLHLSQRDGVLIVGGGISGKRPTTKTRYSSPIAW